MLYVLTILAVYAVRCFPSVFSRPLLVLPALALCIILPGSQERSLFLALCLLLFNLLTGCLPVSGVYTAIAQSETEGAYGIVSADSVQRKNRNTGFYVTLEAVTAGDSVHSARGEVFVIAGQADFFRGDRVFLSGRFQNGYYLASEATLVSRPPMTRLRRRVLELVRRRLSGSSGELGLRLLLGNGEEGSYALKDKAQRAGLSHVLALSGMHLSVLSGLVERIFRRFMGKEKAWRVSAFVLVFFTWLSGWRASLLRALCFRLLSHELEISEAFVLSFLLTIMLIPSYASSLALHYAVLSLSGILLLSAPLAEELSRLTRLPLTVTGAISVSASALLMTVPVTKSVFGSYTLGAILTSAPAACLISLYMTLSLLSLVIPMGFLMRPLSLLIDQVLTLMALVPAATGWGPYLAMAAAALFLLVSKETGTMLDFH